MGRKKKRGARGSLKPSPGCNGETVAGGALGVTGYELLRQQSIRDNMLRMQRLGILDLSLNLASHFLPPKRPRRNPPHHKLSLPSPSQPLRRSSRYFFFFSPSLWLNTEKYQLVFNFFLFCPQFPSWVFTCLTSVWFLRKLEANKRDGPVWATLFFF